MGQKVSPHGLRVGVIKDWDSKWYANKKDFADNLIEDSKVREYVKKKLYLAGISKVLIERSAKDKLRVNIMAGKPGMIIGRSGAGIDELKAELEKLTGKNVSINIVGVRFAEMDAQLTAESVAQALERRVAFRRAMKSAIQRTMKAGGKGIKIVCSGRLGGAEIARSEKYSEGNVPLHTLRANIDYGFAEANTTYGKIGVKVWINKGEVLTKELVSPLPEEKKENRNSRGKDGKQRRGERGERPRRDGERGERPRRDGERSERPRRDGEKRGRFEREEEKKPMPIQRRKLIAKPEAAPQVEEAQVAEAQVVEAAEPAPTEE